MFRLLPTLAVALLGASSVVADDIPTCSLTNKCPEETPCCSQYGQCGVGAYCLGGCDPRMSFSLDACVPAPVCEDRSMTMDSTDSLANVKDYLGDASKADWAVQGETVEHDGGVLLTMAPNTVGTVMASTVYMWYGNVKARMKTGRGRGVVTAFILFSDVKDEIDYEWVGVDLEVAQTNYYFQGIPDYTHSGNITDLSDTFAEYHDYEINWTPDEIQWLVDGEVGRTVKKSDTWNKTANQWDYPQTPSRVQISIWPGGADTNAEGTISWAGGEIDWDSDDIKRDGYYYAAVSQVDIECWKTDSAPGTNSGTSYTYSDAKGTNDTVIDGDSSTILKSLLGTGLDMDKDYPKESSSSSGSSEVIPGLSGGGPGTNGEAGGDSGTGTSGDSATGTDTTPACTQTGFTQDCSASSAGTSDDSTNIGVKQEQMLGASTFAALVAVAGMVWL
ncbi:putative glycoside hydrolase family 16 protein [Eutypa lata UCREL1]|uniref:Crh-like protein n=1 Tax=Eutypa lata (strain UCR-EL1) TaxID=1287681 RepID=M7T7L1_EUTLA|nr:putative glycoside hydrolase family 16 protein [Eutypa lata UCREL1]